VVRRGSDVAAGSCHAHTGSRAVNSRARYMGSRQYPPAPVYRSHVVAKVHYDHGGPCWLRCSCSRLMRAKSPNALLTRWRDHRATAGLRTVEVDA